MKPDPSHDCDHPDENIESSSHIDPNDTNVTYRCDKCWRYWIYNGEYFREFARWRTVNGISLLMEIF